MNFQKLSPSERRLVAIFGLLVAVLINYGLIQFFLKNRALISDLTDQKSAQLSALKTLAEQIPFWQERSDWLRSAQPKIGSEASEGNLLLGFVKESAARNQLTLSKQQLASSKAEGGFTAIPVQFEVKGSWKNFCQFLIELQAPDRFVVIQAARLRVDSTDATQMLGDFTIAKWFAAR